MYTSPQPYHERVANALLDCSGSEFSICIEGTPIESNYCVVVAPHEGITNQSLLHELSRNDVPYITYTEDKRQDNIQSPSDKWLKQLLEVIRLAETMSSTISLQIHAEDLPLFVAVYDKDLPVFRNVHKVIVYNNIPRTNEVGIIDTVHLTK